ncbi:unnamed protein product [Rotaria sordida]|uniref:Uncharacterized protein n=1 Tax=Rotaria sordida TaxID=392033 RepID=A0A814DD63_9BILA|nr:unnamed protein product [Rotaria sordida]CAF4160860.1 unnamed protein product [Rotaria sordida]
MSKNSSTDEKMKTKSVPSESELGKKKIDPIKSFFSGGAGGAFLVIIRHSSDTIKVQEAAKSNKNVLSTEYNGSFDCARQFYRKGGIQNLY